MLIVYSPGSSPASQFWLRPLTLVGTFHDERTLHHFSVDDLVRITVQKTPRGVHHTNQGLVELGAYAIKNLHQRRAYALNPWNPIPQELSTAKTPRYDPLRLANYYQSLIDSGKFESSAALARHLVISRARVSQVLNRLKTNDESPALDAKTGA